jgi:vacuolar protein-sorting-associated protein 4
MVDIVQLRKDAIETATKAVDFDNENDFEKASKMYIRAAEKLQHLSKLDENNYNKETYKKKAMEYLERARQLKESIPEKQPVASTGGVQSKGSNDSNKSDPDQKLKESLASCVITEKPNVKWTDVAGLDKAKQALQEAVILPIKFPNIFTGKRKPWKGILLYGPPGTGKSFLAKACATEAKGTFYSVSASNIVSKWLGESERLVRSLFEMARQNKPSIIFIDEIDSLLSSRTGDNSNEATRRIKTEFLVQMQGVGKEDEGILVLEATNIPWDLDPAVRRRFQKKIYIPLPDEDARSLMVKLDLGDTPNSLTEDDIHELAVMTEGFSGSDIAVLTQDAIFEPIRRCQSAKFFKIEDGFYVPCSPSDEGAFKMTMNELPQPELLKPPIISKDDFIQALIKIKPTVSPSELKKHDIFTLEFGQEG